MAVTDPEREEAEDQLDRMGEEPAAESGAGYGSHAPEPDEAKESDDTE